jgi:hypothetical protein
MHVTPQCNVQLCEVIMQTVHRLPAIPVYLTALHDTSSTYREQLARGLRRQRFDVTLPFDDTLPRKKYVRPNWDVCFTLNRPKICKQRAASQLRFGHSPSSGYDQLAVHSTHLHVLFEKNSQ